MSDCLHVNLERIANPEEEGKIWVCKECGTFFTIAPAVIHVEYGEVEQ